MAHRHVVLFVLVAMLCLFHVEETPAAIHSYVKDNTNERLVDFELMQAIHKKLDGKYEDLQIVVSSCKSGRLYRVVQTVAHVMIRVDRAERLGDIAAVAKVRRPCWSGPLHGVCQNLLYIVVVVDRKGFMSGAKIEYLAFAAAECAARAEYLAALEPTNQDHFVRRRYVEELAVHLRVR